MGRRLSENPKNTAWLEEIIPSLPLGVHQYELRDDRLIFTGGNKAADTILGIRHAELIGKTLEEAFPPLSDTEIPLQYKKVAHSGVAFEAEQVNYKDQEISGAFQVYAVQTVPGKIAVMFRDITEKKKAVEALRMSEEKLHKYNEELVRTKQELDKSLQSLASVNRSLLEMQVNLENTNTDLKEKNEEYFRLNQDYEAQNEQLKRTNIRLEETNTRIIEISRRIRSNEQQLRIVLENSKDIIYSINYSSGTFEYVSPVISDILGLSDTTFLHQPPDTLFNLMHPDDIRQFGKYWQNIIDLEEKDTFLFEIGYRLKDRDGNYHWMSENNKLLKDEGGRPLYLIGSIRDITDLKNSDIALRNSEERLGLAIEATDQGLWDTDLKNNTRYFSPRCFSILGYKPGEIPFISETFFSHVHPDEKEFLLEKMNSFSDPDKSLIRVEFRVRHKTGKTVWVLSRGKCVERNEKGIATRMVGTYTDITERKTFELTLKQKNEELQAAEEELRITNDELLLLNEKQEVQNRELKETYEKLKASEENFKQLAENIVDIFWLREGQKLVYLSSAFEKVTGIMREEAIKDPDGILAIIHPGDNHVRSFFGDPDIFENDGFITDQFRILKPDGSIRWIWSRIFPVYNREGKLYRMAGIASDITLQKNLESELRTAKDKAQESDRLKSTFLANISHEIRTPMNGIIGFAGLLTHTAINDESRSRYIEIINKSSDQLLHIIDDLIDISKIEANQVQVVCNPCNINSLLDEIHIVYSRELMLAEKKQIELIPIYALNNENSSIMTDELRLRQIIGNLMSNAVKFTEKGTIRFGYEMEAKDHIKFFVEDSGIGIDPSKSEMVFQPFRQVDEGDARKFGGAGLGLSISLGFIKMLQGRMWHESTPGKGTSFYFTLPYLSAGIHEHPVESPQEKKGPVWSDRRILIVEDDDMNFEYLQAILESTSIFIDRAKDGVQAVDACKKEKFDMVLMDIRIPKLDGLQATRKIRESGLKIPVIAQTAFAMASDKDKCLDAGCNDYIAKPVNKDALIEVLSRYLTGDP
jgi:PAS domain S-box-containing protein